jgi:hypothetical protein
MEEVETLSRITKNGNVYYSEVHIFSMFSVILCVSLTLMFVCCRCKSVTYLINCPTGNTLHSQEVFLLLYL